MPPESCLGGEERLPDAGQGLGVNAGTLVPDDDKDVRPLGVARGGDEKPFCLSGRAWQAFWIRLRITCSRR